MLTWYKSPGYFWFRIFGYGIHAKRPNGIELFSLRGKRYIEACGWRLRWLVPDKAN